MKEKNRNKSEFLGWVRFITISLVIVFGLYAVFNYLPFFKNKEQYIIVSNSMEPTFNVGDLIIVDTDFKIEDLKVDDIIAFYQDLNADNKNEIVIHYIAKINEDEQGNKTFQTKREGVTSTLQWDAWTLAEDEIVGTYLYDLPKVGNYLLFASSSFGKVIIFVDIVTILIVIDFFKKSRRRFI